ncbi:MAG: hypothetical protein ACIAXF_03135 [Phycisphaerales bacterium JB063]
MLMRTLTTVLLALGVLLAGGCVKMKQIVTVMPDGSGKLEFTMGVSQMLVAQAGENPLDQFTLEEMAGDEMPQGIVAMTAPQKWEEGGFEYVTFTMYFDDINEVAGPEGETEEMFANYTFTNDGDGCTLTVNGGMALELSANYEKPGADELQMMQQMMNGFEIVERYVLPGEAEDIEGVEMIDNTADITIDLDTLVEGDGPIAALQGKDSMVLTVGENTIDDATVEAFAAELAQAIVEWEALKEEMDMEME